MRDPWKRFKDFLTTDWLRRDVPGLALSAAPGTHCELHLSQCTSVYSCTSWHTFSWCLSSVQCTPNWQQDKRKILAPWEREYNCDFGKKESLMLFQQLRSRYYNWVTPSVGSLHNSAGFFAIDCNQKFKKKQPTLHKKKWGPRKIWLSKVTWQSWEEYAAMAEITGYLVREITASCLGKCAVTVLILTSQYSHLDYCIINLACVLKAQYFK